MKGKIKTRKRWSDVIQSEMKRADICEKGARNRIK